MKLGVIARADHTGLGIQSRNWVRLLQPHKIIVINSKPFNGNEQHYEWYMGKPNVFRIDGFIQQKDVNAVLDDIDVLLTFEIPYNYQLISMAKSRGIKTIVQTNWEFNDWLKHPEYPQPDIMLNHSYWHLDDQKSLFPDITEYSPTPVFVEDYENIYDKNVTRTMLTPRPPAPYPKRRFLHIAGRKTHEDRNGTLDLIESLKHIPKEIDFELVIKSQTTEIPNINDPRVVIDERPVADEKELYRDFDAMILPRKYGGACLPMNEALASGLPVIMTDVEPNSKVLPEHWLVKSPKTSVFMARTLIDIHTADHKELAARIAQFAVLSPRTLTGYKIEARNIAIEEYSSESVKHKWDLLMQKLSV